MARVRVRLRLRVRVRLRVRLRVRVRLRLGVKARVGVPFGARARVRSRLERTQVLEEPPGPLVGGRVAVVARRMRLHLLAHLGPDNNDKRSERCQNVASAP